MIFDLETIGYFLFMEEQEKNQEQEELECAGVPSMRNTESRSVARIDQYGHRATETAGFDTIRHNPTKSKGK